MAQLDLSLRAQRRHSLSQAMMKRPTIEELQGAAATANILPADEAESIDKQLDAKRKLSGFAAR